MSTGFADHFAKVAGAYAGFRPRYPAALYAWLAEIAPRRELAWDCACGSGQASLDLAAHFDHVVATDASAAQIAAAPACPNITFRVAPAESSGLPDASVDLVAVAQALHWFDFDRFYAEVRRVAKPGGLLAVWTYSTLSVEGEDVEARVEDFYRNIVGPYWPPERRHVESGYRTLPFPFDEIAAPEFTMQAGWNLPELLGYFRSWSSTGRFMAARGFDPVARLEEQVLPLWKDPDARRLVRCRWRFGWHGFRAR